MKNIIIFYLISIILIGNLKAEYENWSFFNMDNSILPDNDIRTVKVDSKDVIWAGTYFGLVKFDGAEWTLYTSKNTELPSDFINNINFDNNNNVWIGTTKGLAKFDGINYTVFNANNSGLSTDNIENFTIDKLNNIWVEKTGTSGHGVIKFDGASWQSYSSNIENAFTTCMDIDKNGKIIVGTNKGLLVFDNDIWVQYNKTNSDLPDNLVMSIAIDSLNNYWIGTYEGGLAKFDGNSWQIYDENNSGLSEHTVKAICIDKLDNKWIGTMSKGLAKFDNSSWELFDSENSGLSDNNINEIAVNKSGNIIIGTVSGGLSIYEPETDFVFENENNEINVDIFPNPSNEFVRLSVKNSNALCLSKIVISNTSGKEVISQTLKQNCSNFDIKTQHLPSGIYYFKLLDSFGNITAHDKFLVIR